LFLSERASEPARKGRRDGGREEGVIEGATDRKRDGGGGVGEGMETACGQKAAFRKDAHY
jgi:hypothetical protein